MKIIHEAKRILRKLNVIELRVIAEFLKGRKKDLEEKLKAVVLRGIQASLKSVEEEYQQKGLLQALPIPVMYHAQFEKFSSPPLSSQRLRSKEKLKQLVL